MKTVVQMEDRISGRGKNWERRDGSFFLGYLAGAWRIHVLFLLSHDPKWSIFWHMHLRGRFQHVPFTRIFASLFQRPFTAAKKYLGLWMEIKNGLLFHQVSLRVDTINGDISRSWIYFPLSNVIMRYNYTQRQLDLIFVNNNLACSSSSFKRFKWFGLEAR